jgi:phosphatidylglycerophosphate synthase
MKRIDYSSVPNLLSGFRLLLAVALWIPATLDLPLLVGAGLIMAGLTDVLDGFLARRWRAATEYGSRLDSAADMVLVVCAAFWVILVEPSIFLDNKLLVLSWMLIGTASLAVGLIKFRRIPDLHLYMTKASSAAGYVFIIFMFVVGYNAALFYIASALLILSTLESLLLQLLTRKPDEHIRSILYAYRQWRNSSGPSFS